MNLFKIKIKNTTYGVSFSFFFVVALVSVCSGTQADMLFVTLMCCALHELGHLVLMLSEAHRKKLLSMAAVSALLLIINSFLKITILLCFSVVQQ